MRLACNIRDLLSRSCHLVVNFEKTGQEVTHRLPLCRFQGHKLPVESLACDCRACSVKALPQSEPQVMRIIRVINIDPDCWCAGIVNNSLLRLSERTR